MDSNNPSTFEKVIKWLIAFPISVVAFTIVAIFDYLQCLFDMPVELWELLGSDDVEDESES